MSLTYDHERYDPFRPEFRSDPYPWYRALRDNAPVYFAPEANVWCVSRYDDVQAVLRARRRVLVARDVHDADEQRPGRRAAALVARRCASSRGCSCARA